MTHRTMASRYPTLVSLAALAALLLGAPVAQAQGAAASPATILLRGEQQLQVSSDDMQADAWLRVPPESRVTVLSDANAVSQVSSNLYVRRMMAAQAREAGLDKDPKLAAAIRIVQDKVLSDAWLERIDASVTNNEAAIDSITRDIYRANPERFKHGGQVHVSHILIQGNTDESRERAEKLLAELKAGAKFDDMAKEQSQDPGSAQRGGDLGWFEKGRMVPEFEEAAFALKKPGELSGLVKTQFGYHILKLDERREPGVSTFIEVRDNLRKEVVAKRLQDARSAAAQKILEGAKPDAEAVRAFSAAQKP